MTIDGDLVEMFLDSLSKTEMETVVMRLNDDLGCKAESAAAAAGVGAYGSRAGSSSSQLSNVRLSVEDVLRRVEDISRLH
jgi:hypothetical protein